ncbi:MAG: cytochrome C oxidase subunit II [Paenibacillaceae bacterium]
MQQSAWYISLLFMALIIFVFVVVFFQSGRRTDYAPIQKKGYRIRRFYLATLLFILIYAGVISLKQLPYDQPVFAAGDPIVIEVNAIQFNWEMSSNQVKVGEPVEFAVTSSDVNHGFGIYDENMIVMTQTQAMPGYTNKLYYTFTKPGKYQILCLEYCGLAHHYMVADFEVLPNEEA